MRGLATVLVLAAAAHGHGGGSFRDPVSVPPGLRLPSLRCSCGRCAACIPFDSLPERRIRVLRSEREIGRAGDFARIRITLALHTIEDGAKVATVRLAPGPLFVPTRATLRRRNCAVDSSRAPPRPPNCTRLRVKPVRPGVVDVRAYPVAPGALTVATVEGVVFRPFGFGYRLYRTRGAVAVVAPDDSIAFVTRDEARSRFPRLEPVVLDGIVAMRRSAANKLAPLVAGSHPSTSLPACGHVRAPAIVPPPPPHDPLPPPEPPPPCGNPPLRR